MSEIERAIAGCLIGTAVGDSLGLPCEGLSRERGRKLFPDLTGHHFLFGWGMVSDDTQHTVFVAQALMASGGDPADGAAELVELVGRAAHSAVRGESANEFADGLGLTHGVSGYVYHTVPVALQVWLGNSEDYRSGVLEVIRCGGDTDTTAGIAGALIGARVSICGIPEEWRNGLWEWPCSVKWMEQLGRRLASSVSEAAAQECLPVARAAIPPRSLIFLAAVLTHGFRRLFPPY